MITWPLRVLVSIVAELAGFVMVPLAIALDWPRWMRAVWGNDDGFLTGWPDPWDNAYAFPWPEQYKWFAIRNRAHNASKFLGKVVANEFYLRGNPEVTDHGTEGWRLVTQHEAFEFYWVKKLPIERWPLCLRVRLGWALHGEEPGTVAGLKHSIAIRRFGVKGNG